MKRPKLLFFGTPLFAAEVLESLITSGWDIAGVISKPDKPLGRSKRLVPTPVKEVALRHQLPLFQPEKVSAAEHSKLVESFGADLFVVVAYGEIIKEHLLKMPPMGCINVHASLLPFYRGAAPIQRCLIEGALMTGITIMHMAKQMDAGDIISQRSFPIPEDLTYGELSTQLCCCAKELLPEALLDLAAGSAQRIPQDHTQATYAPKIELEECQLLWSRPAQQLHNLVRGTSPEPGAWSMLEVRNELKRCHIARSRVIKGLSGTPGSLISCGVPLAVACGSDALEILALQVAGKRLMNASEWLCGLSQVVSSISFI